MQKINYEISAGNLPARYPLNLALWSLLADKVYNWHWVVELGCLLFLALIYVATFYVRKARVTVDVFKGFNEYVAKEKL